MWPALVWKEWRECSIFAGLAFLALAQLLGEAMDLPLVRLVSLFSTGRGAEIPLLSGGREALFTWIMVLVAVIIGFQQTLWESWRQTTLFLLHRPAPRSQIYLCKLFAGGSLLLLVGAVPLLVFCLWAATPATHASPFYWTMSEPWCRSLAAALACYLGAFYCGLRPARWIGSRLLPAITTGLLVMGLKYAPMPGLWAYIGLLVLAAGLVFLILEEARVREYP